MDKSTDRSIMELMAIETPWTILDPTVGEGSQVVYCSEHCFLIRIQEKPEMVQTLKEPEQLRVKVMVEYEH